MSLSGVVSVYVENFRSGLEDLLYISIVLTTELRRGRKSMWMVPIDFQYRTGTKSYLCTKIPSKYDAGKTPGPVPEIVRRAEIKVCNLLSKATIGAFSSQASVLPIYLSAYWVAE